MRRELDYIQRPFDPQKPEVTVCAWSPEELDEKIGERCIHSGPLSRVVHGRRQYYAYVSADPRKGTRLASLRALLPGRGR